MYRLCSSSVLCACLLSIASTLALGDISGTVTLVGKAASRDTPPVYSGTVTGCGGNGYHATENWKIGPKGELGDVVVWVEDPKLVAPVTLDPNHPVSNPKMNQAQCTYVPYVIATTPSRGVEFVNSDPVLHNVLAKTSAGADQADGDVVFNLPEIEGQHSTQGFDTPGLYMLQCSSHSWMQAWVYVLPENCDGFFAVSDKLGAFAFGQAPYTLADGDYVVKAWHSRFHDLVAGKLHCVHGTGTVQLVFQGDKSF